ncbi:MAG: FmdB family zinc ribbon protein [Cellvibrionaceae bacterium]
MPIYEYQCSECQHELEALQKMSDPALVDCPECSKPALVKKISAAAFRLSGSGWYETDFKSGKKKNLAGDAGNSSTKTDSSTATGSNAKKPSGSSSSSKTA